MTAVHTPTCERCGTKFPGREFCRACGYSPLFAEAERREAAALERERLATHAPRMPRATRRRRKHGRQ